MHSDQTKLKIADAVTKNRFTAEQDTFLLANADSLSIKQMATHLDFDNTAIWRRLQQLGYHHNPELSRTKKIIANKLAGQRPEVKEKLRKAVMGRKYSEEYKRKMSQTITNRIISGKIHPYGFVVGFHQSSKAGQVHYQSSYELIYYKQLDENDTVVSYKAHPFAIIYNLNNQKKNYIPDVIVEFIDGRQMLVEIKPNDLINLPENIAKRQAAEKYCVQNNLVYQLVTETQLGIE